VDTDADDFQNLIRSSSTQYNLWRFFMKIRSVVLREVANKQTDKANDRQTPDKT